MCVPPQNKSQLNQAKSAVQTWVNNLYDTQCCPGGVLSKACPIYDWVSQVRDALLRASMAALHSCSLVFLLSQSDCASKDAFFTAIKSFVKKHFGAIAGILFGAAALQILTCCISCHVIRKGRAEQKKEEAAAAPASKQAVQTVYYAPPVVSQPMANPYNSQPQVAADHRF